MSFLTLLRINHSHTRVQGLQKNGVDHMYYYFSWFSLVLLVLLIRYQFHFDGKNHSSYRWRIENYNPSVFEFIFVGDIILFSSFIVYDMHCYRCGTDNIYDGCEDGLLRMKGFLIHHKVLCDYMLFFLKGKRWDLLHFLAGHRTPFFYLLPGSQQ